MNEKKLIQNLKEFTPFYYEYGYKVISKASFESNHSVYIAVMSIYGDLAYILHYRTDIQFLVSVHNISENRPTSLIMKVWEEATKRK